MLASISNEPIFISGLAFFRYSTKVLMILLLYKGNPCIFSSTPLNKSYPKFPLQIFEIFASILYIQNPQAILFLTFYALVLSVVDRINHQREIFYSIVFCHVADSSENDIRRCVWVYYKHLKTVQQI